MRKSKKIVIIFSTAITALFLIYILIVFYSRYDILVNEGPSIPCANYDQDRRIIIIVHECTLSEVHDIIDNDNILKKETSGDTWLLNSSILVSEGALLTIEATEAKWIKINSEGKSIISMEPVTSGSFNESSPHFIQVFGRIDLLGVKITSWDPSRNNYTFQKPDGSVSRPYITVGSGAGPSHLENAEVAYLGFNSSRKQGLSFYGGDYSTLKGNRVHDLWYGFFSTNVGHLVLESNTVFDNKRYGVDPHLHSHDMVVKGNHIYNSRIGLICSLECSNILFEGNLLENNQEVGLMLSRKAINSTVKYNNISSSNVGLAISESHSNTVTRNLITKSNIGLSVTNNSTRNVLTINSITDPLQCGIRVSLGAKNNTIEANFVEGFNRSGICVGIGGDLNSFKSNEIEGFGLYGIDVKDRANENIFRDNSIHLANHAIRVYNNNDTLFINNKVGNTFGHQYIVAGNATLNLEDTRFIGDTIRSAGESVNIARISHSGIIDVTTKRAGQAGFETSRHDSDFEPYVANMTSETLKLYSK